MAINIDYSAINWQNKPSTASPINATNLNKMDTELGNAVSALNGLSKSDIGLGNVDNTSDASKPISNATQTALNNKVDKIVGKGLSTNDYTSAEKTKLAGIEAGAEVNVQSDWGQGNASSDAFIKNKPTKLSEFTNDSGFITTTVNNLTNYYLKTQVDNLIGSVSTISITVVQTLPETGQSNTIYLVPQDPSNPNIYNEYVYANNTWVNIGSSEIDLSDYYTKTESDAKYVDWESNNYLGAKNLNIYPYYETSHTDHNVVFTDNGDGTVTANGKATGGSGDFNCHSHTATSEIYPLVLSNGKYIVSGCPSGGSTSTYYIQIGYYDTTGNFAVLGRDLGDGIEITLNGDYYSSDSVRLNITCRIYNGYTANNLLFKPMIRLAGDSDTTFTKYSKTNSELQEDISNLYKNNAFLSAKNLNIFPYYYTTRTDNNVTFTVNSDGTVSTSGTATAITNFYFHSRLETASRPLILPNGTYTISGCPAGGSSEKYEIQIARTHNNASETLARDYGNGAAFTLNGDDYSDNEVYVAVYIVIRNGQNTDGLVFKPMIRIAGDTDDTWHPYAMTNKQITDAIGNPPTTAGTYSLQLVVDANGNRTYSWV